MPGLKLNIFRMVGKVLNLVSLILNVIILFVLIDELLIMNLVLTIGIGVLVAQFYLENDFMDKYRKLIILAVLIFVMLFNLIWMFVVIEGDANEEITLLFLMYTGDLAGIFYQQYSLSIYKKEKLGFLISFGLVILGFIGALILFNRELVLIIISMVLAIIGFVLIMTIENKLRKKKLLNYI